MTFALFNRMGETKPKEISEREIVEKINSLGINYEHLERKGKSIYTFFNVKPEGHNAFLLDTNEGKKVIFQTIHFDKDEFKNPSEITGKVSPEEMFQYVSKKFNDADEIIYNCCYPDDAKEVVKGMKNKPIIIGSGSSEYRTVYNSNKNFITVSPVE